MTVRHLLIVATAGVLTAQTVDEVSSTAAWTLSSKLGYTRPAPFPDRPGFAVSGSEFLRLTAGYSSEEREQAILREVRAGNVPSHLRHLVPIKVEHDDHTAVLFVLPDYLAVGSDDDYVNIPMTPRTAMDIAKAFGFTLPTPKLVDDIYHHATMKLKPTPLTPSRLMSTNNYYLDHDEKIKLQLSVNTNRPLLMAGHKKDVVLSNRLAWQHHRVAIYGWHRSVDDPIQPLSLVHGEEYVDYSHGIRFVSRQVAVDGVKQDLEDILSDPQLSPLVSNEGQLLVQGYP